MTVAIGDGGGGGGEGSNAVFSGDYLSFQFTIRLWIYCCDLNLSELITDLFFNLMK